MIIAFSEDGMIAVHDDEPEAKRQWEPIDVESRAVVFYDEDGTWLRPDFTKPNNRKFFGMIRAQRDYSLVRSATPPEIDPINVALSEATGVAPNAHFDSVEAIARHIRARQNR